MIWTHGEEHPKSFIGFLNSIHPSIKFTHEYSNSLHQILPFLDVQVHLINNHIETDLHTKPTDKQLQQLGPLPDNAILVTLDVSSLYTNIPHNEGIDACRYFLNTRQDKSLPAENICGLIRMILPWSQRLSFNIILFHLEICGAKRWSKRRVGRKRKLSFLGSQRFVPIKTNIRSDSRRKIFQ